MGGHVVFPIVLECHFTNVYQKLVEKMDRSQILELVKLEKAGVGACAL